MPKFAVFRFLEDCSLAESDEELHQTEESVEIGESSWIKAKGMSSAELCNEKFDFEKVIEAYWPTGTEFAKWTKAIRTGGAGKLDTLEMTGPHKAYIVRFSDQYEELTDYRDRALRADIEASELNTTITYGRGSRLKSKKRKAHSHISSSEDDEKKSASAARCSKKKVASAKKTKVSSEINSKKSSAKILAELIRKKKNDSCAKSESETIPGPELSLREENKTLKEENQALRSALTKIRGLCSIPPCKTNSQRCSSPIRLHVQHMSQSQYACTGSSESEDRNTVVCREVKSVNQIRNTICSSEVKPVVDRNCMEVKPLIVNGKEIVQDTIIRLSMAKPNSTARTLTNDLLSAPIENYVCGVHKDTTKKNFDKYGNEKLGNCRKKTKSKKMNQNVNEEE